MREVLPRLRRRHSVRRRAPRAPSPPAVSRVNLGDALLDPIPHGTPAARLRPARRWHCVSPGPRDCANRRAARQPRHAGRGVAHAAPAADNGRRPRLHPRGARPVASRPRLAPRSPCRVQHRQLVGGRPDRSHPRADPARCLRLRAARAPPVVARSGALGGPAGAYSLHAGATLGRGAHQPGATAACRAAHHLGRAPVPHRAGRRAGRHRALPSHALRRREPGRATSRPATSGDHRLVRGPARASRDARQGARAAGRFRAHRAARVRWLARCRTPAHDGARAHRAGGLCVVPPSRAPRAARRAAGAADRRARDRPRPRAARLRPAQVPRPAADRAGHHRRGA